MRIEVKDLTYSYEQSSKKGGQVALDKVSITIEEGEFFGIIGQTGSGKSTFVQHLNGLIKIAKDCGSVKIGEFDLTDKKCDFKALRKKVGMVFQYPEHQLFAETVFEDVAFGLKNFAPEMSAREVEERVEQAITLVGLDYKKVKEKSPFELSGGQKRRVAIAGVIVTKPEILVLDEPVAGLDPAGKKDFLALLNKLHKMFVKTIILVSHDMNVISEHCSRAAIFSAGKIRSVGTPKDIFADEEGLISLGLSLPTTAFIEKRLSHSGINPKSDLTVSDFIEKICQEFLGGKR